MEIDNKSLFFNFTINFDYIRYVGKTFNFNDLFLFKSL